jgi:hypothetical protein
MVVCWCIQTYATLQRRQRRSGWFRMAGFPAFGGEGRRPFLNKKGKIFVRPTGAAKARMLDYLR